MRALKRARTLARKKKLSRSKPQHPAPETQQPSETMSTIRALLAAGLTLGLSTQAATTDTGACFW